jgi:hypothetical protein
MDEAETVTSMLLAAFPASSIVLLAKLGEGRQQPIGNPASAFGMLSFSLGSFTGSVMHGGSFTGATLNLPALVR